VWQRRPKIAPDAKPSAGWSLRELQVVVGLDLELPRQLGATDTMNSTSADMVAAVRALTNGDGVDYAFEVIGRAGTTKACSFRMLRRGGPAVAVGIAPAGALVATEPASLCTRRRTFKGSHYGSSRPHTDVGQILELYLRGLVLLDVLVGWRCRLEEINEAFAAMDAGRSPALSS